MDLKDETLLVISTNASAHTYIESFLNEFWDTIRDQCGPKLRVTMCDGFFDHALHLDYEVNKLSTAAMVELASNNGHGSTDINGLLSVVGQMPEYTTVRNVIFVYSGNDVFRKSIVDAEWRKFENLIVMVTNDAWMKWVTPESKQAMPRMYNQRIFDPYTFKILLWGE